MMRCLRRSALVLLLLALAAAVPASAQWSIGAGYRTDRYYGSIVTSTVPGVGRIQFRPLRPDVLDLSVHRQIGRLRVGLIGSTFTAGFAGEADDIVLQTGAVYQVDELAVEAGLDLVRHVRLTGGPVVGRWQTLGEADRTVLGGQLSLDFEAPLRWGVRVYGRVGGAVVGSPFDPASLEGTQTRGRLSRRSLVTGLRLGV